ncbi:MAG: dihydropteroate synthase [Geobacter sp.]|nr:MAG: dihydropteroate synthase [Geobacter sp.]
MGILNVTPDSFSDGNRFFFPEKAVERALAMEADGADIIDIGGESTRPNAPPVSAEEELRRVVPVVECLAGRLGIPISVDTTKAVVAEAALAAGAEIINDVSAMTFDARMAGVIAAAGAGVVLQHTRGTPVEMQHDTSYGDLVGEVTRFLEDAIRRARQAGITDGQMVVDPGIGFGKDCAGNLEILRRLDEFSSLGRPILVGTSRKAFIGKVLDRGVDDRLFGTAATVALALVNGATVFRVHDVRAMRDVAYMSRAIVQGIR